MSRSVNRVFLMGHTGSSPEVRTTPNGTQVANVSLATNYTRRGKNGVVTEHTDWHKLVFWDRLAGVVEQYVGKGERIYVEGRIQYDSYEKDGVTVKATEIVVTDLVMLGSLDAERGAVPAGDVSDEDPDLPF